MPRRGRGTSRPGCRGHRAGDPAPAGLGIAKAYLGWSRLHFETLGWPDDTRATVDAFQAAYDSSVDGIHRFDLPRSSEASLELLTELRAFFDGAWDTLQREREAAATAD